mmetsp:Transcript_16348/g.23057  ORF Transcript_16348/g.23057 Transcript_16348/m.23057 type:complete len:332 (-) Transcript_16348:242-1237(-)
MSNTPDQANPTPEEKKLDLDVSMATTEGMKQLKVHHDQVEQQQHILTDIQTNSTDEAIETNLSHDTNEQHTNHQQTHKPVLQAREYGDGMVESDFVEQFDTTFNDFIGANPKFLIENPDLVHKLRISKLQSALKRTDLLAEELQVQLQDIKESQQAVEANFAAQLKEASQKKAALDIQVHKQLIDIQRACRLTEGDFTWALVEGTERQVKKEARLRQKLQDEKNENQPQLLTYTREELLKLLPEKEPEFYSIFEAANATESRGGSEDEIRQCQLDIAFLHGEVAMLKKKLGYQKQIAERNKWVESMLLALDEPTMKSMKEAHQKKVEAPQD